MTYSVEFYRGDKWSETNWAKLPGDTRTEAERLAAVRSMNGLVYRVRKGKQTISKFQNGNQLTKEDNA